MKIFKLIFIFSLVLVTMNAFAQKERKYIRQGNKEYDNENFENSEISYRKAMDLDEKKTHKPLFNVGDALYKQEKYEEAIDQFNNLADYELSKEEKSKIYYNLGNSLLKNNKLKESIDAYKNALRNNPNDMDAKYNLAYAQKKLEEQEQQQQNQDQDQNKDQDKDKKDQEQNKDQQNQDQNKDNQDQNKDQNQQDKQDQNKDQEQQQQQKPEISKEDAERILQALANDEKDTQKKVKEQQAAAAKVKVEKEW